MQAFRFRLQRVLHVREKQLEVEEVRFKQAAAAVAELDRSLSGMRASVALAETELRRSSKLDGSELAAFDSYRSGMQRRERELLGRRRERLNAMERQQAVMMEARRRCRLLERLKERRREEWDAARDRELEETASESFLAGWARGQRLSDSP